MSLWARLAAVAACALVAAPAAQAGDFTKRASVTRVIDGDTIVVRLDGGRSERVRVIGIDTPEVGDCWAAQATAETRRLADGKHVTLIGDGTQDTRDRYGRLLAYVWLPGGKDLGFQLMAGGYARKYIYDRPFERLAAYENAAALARGKGVWRCGTSSPPPPPPARGNCHPSYKGACLDPNASDYDCAGLGGNGPKFTGPVRVIGPDVFHLDSDGDGYACESA